jgi:hypothetical protein
MVGDLPHWPPRPWRRLPAPDQRCADEEHRRRASGAILMRLHGDWLLAPRCFPLIRLTKCKDCDGLQGTAMICKSVRISDGHCWLEGMRPRDHATGYFHK